jgi:hypothetical protein
LQQHARVTVIFAALVTQAAHRRAPSHEGPRFSLLACPINVIDDLIPTNWMKSKTASATAMAHSVSSFCFIMV